MPSTINVGETWRSHLSGNRYKILRVGLTYRNEPAVEMLCVAGHRVGTREKCRVSVVHMSLAKVKARCMFDV